MKMKKSISLLVATAMTLVVFAGCSSSDEYPNRNISAIVPYAAGGTTDLTVRSLVDAIPSDALPSNKNITVSNVPGAGGLVGISQFLAAESDGYTLGIVNADLILNKVMENTEISHEDFIPVATLMSQPNLLLVSADAPYDTFEEFVEYARANPNEIKVGNSGEGTIPRLGAQAVENALGLVFKYVTYDGDTTSVTAVVSGEVDATFASAAPSMGQINAGTVKPLTVTDYTRMDSFPEVPAMGEVYEELSGVRILTWVYLAAKNDVPTDTIEYLQDLFAKASSTEKFRTTQKSFSIEKTTFNGVEKEFEFMEEQYKFYEDLLGK